MEIFYKLLKKNLWQRIDLKNNGDNNFLNKTFGRDLTNENG